MIKIFLKNKIKSILPLPNDMPNWKKLLKNKSNFFFKKLKKKKILIATSSGGHKVATSFESLLGISLSLKGSIVEFLLCNKILTGCIMTTDENTKEKELLKEKQTGICHACFDIGKKTFEKTGLKIHYLGDFISQKDLVLIDQTVRNTSINDIKNYNIAGANIGEQTIANVLRYYAIGDLSLEKNSELVIKKYFKSALVTEKAIRRLFEQEKYDVIVLNHGIYVPQGIITEIAKSKKINYVTWTTGARKNTFIFSHNDIYNKDIVGEDNSNWADIRVKKIEKEIDEYLQSKILGTEDWQYQNNKISLKANQYLASKKIDLSKPTIGLATNVIWDAQLHYDDTIFYNMVDWILKTINYFISRKDLNLIIRIHPTEVNSDRPAKQKVKDEILKYYSVLPDNILIIDSNDPISTYAVLDFCNTILIYGTKLGVEFAARGVPVVIAGEAVIRNKGFSIEPSSEKEYFEVLKSLPLKNKMNQVQTENAKKFAYHYYFRRMLEIDSIENIPFNFPPFKIKSNFIDILSRESDKNLELICNSIISGDKFY
jgi:hypothetical protein